MAVLTAGYGQEYATLGAAVAASHDGDTIYVAAGTYYDDSAIINTKISIVGVGGMAHFVATKPIANSKGILVTNTDVTIDHLEFSGATVGSGNGAGIRYEGGKLTIENSYFHDNQEGILAASVAGGAITIDHSEFAHNGTGNGYTHNIYVDHIANLTVTNSYLHDAPVGHELKSRATNTTILDNRIDDANGTASYSIDLPNGGNAVIQGNIIRQGPNSQNPIIISYAEESAPYAHSHLSITGNTILNDYSVHTPLALKNASNISAAISGNHFYGLTSSQIATGPNVQTGNDSLAAAPAMDTSHPWAASPWDALVSGGSGADVIDGSSGNDLFVGGAGADTFHAGSGQDTIADFSAAQGDKIDLSGVPGIQSLLNPLLQALQSGLSGVIDLGGGSSLTLMNATLSNLLPSDFIFGSGGAGPTGIALSDSSVAEDSANGTVIGTLSAIDSDPNATLGFSIASDPDGVFAIDGGNLVVAGPLDFETEASHAVTVRVTDGSGETFDQAFTVKVLNLPGVSITGTAANDSLMGTVEEDTLNGGAGADTMAGGLGNDLYCVDNTQDTIIESSGGGFDSVRSSATYVLPDNVENLALTGTAGIAGTGNSEANLLVGNKANNVLAGLGGADTLDGGSGSDTANYAASPSAVNVSLSTGIGSGGDAAGDTLIRIESLAGSSYDDTLTGNWDANALTGGAGNDSLSGGTGKDTLWGGPGTDTLSGGGAADRFVFNLTADSSVTAPDTIADFSHAQGDRIDLSHIDANTVQSGNQTFTFIGKQAFHHVAGELNFAAAGDGSLIVSGDVNGDGAADFSIAVHGPSSLVAGDFLL